MKNRFGLVALLQCVCVYGQTESTPGLATDRPGFTEPTNVIAPGALQLEYGYHFERSKDGERIFIVGAPLVRVGVSKRFELRFASNGMIASAGQGESWKARQLGMGDSSIGAKIGIVEEGRFRPAIAILPSLSLPTGSSLYSSRAFERRLILSCSKDIVWGLNVGGNEVVASGVKEGRLEHAFSFSVGRNMGGGFGGYIEYYGIRPSDRAERRIGVANGGVTYQVGPNVQVDVETGWAVAGAGPRFLLAGGVVIRGAGVLRPILKLR